jgi:hypothetical protein
LIGDVRMKIPSIIRVTPPKIFSKIPIIHSTLEW